MKFTKYSSSGNDFLFFDNREDKISFSNEKIIELCQRKLGVGADGIVLVGKSSKADLSMRIFNADASEAEMCGNALRAISHFAHHYLKIHHSNEYSIETMNGVYTSWVDGDKIKVKMTELYDVASVDVSDIGLANSLFLNTGVPHCVVEVANIEGVHVKGFGEKIRNDKRFENGTNVSFFEVINKDKKQVKVRFYERGVEDETLCCGTGVMATAVSCQKFFGWEGQISIESEGGDVCAYVDANLQNLIYEGSVLKVFDGVIDV